MTLQSQFLEFFGAGPIRRALFTLCTVQGFDEPL